MNEYASFCCHRTVPYGAFDPRVLVIVPTYNPTDNWSSWTVWVETLRAIENQIGVDCDIVIADNVSGNSSMALLSDISKNHNFNLIHTNTHYTCPYLQWNIAAQKFKDSKYDYYIYCASDAIFQRPDDLKTLIEDMPDDCSIITPQLTSDTSQRRVFDENMPPTMINLGQAVNGHIFLIKKEFMEKYDYKLPDIMYSNGVEELIPYLCEAIGRKQYVSHKAMMTHVGKVDRKNRPSSDRIENDYYVRNFRAVLMLGKLTGFGFKENDIDFQMYWDIYHNSDNWEFKIVYLKFMLLKYISTKLGRGIHPYYMKHDESLLDKEELYQYMKKYFFMSPIEFNYNKENL